MKKSITLLLSVFLILCCSCTKAEQVSVYITNTGTKYHRSNCRYLEHSKIEISLEKAVKSYEPCSVCKPSIINE